MTETPAQYEIKSLSDFLNIPTEKLPECLVCFEQWIAALRQPTSDLFGDLSAALKIGDTFIWIDDGLSGISQINFVCGDKRIGTVNLNPIDMHPNRRDLQIEYVSVNDRLPEAGAEVEVIRDYGSVVLNGGHNAYGCRFGIERTRFENGPMFGFVCDMKSTGIVTHWRDAEPMDVGGGGYPGLDDLLRGDYG